MTDFQNPKVPANQREFFILYTNQMEAVTESLKAISKKMDDITESQADDRDNVISLFDKLNNWKNCHDIDATKRQEKIDQLEKKVNAWSLTNTLAAIGAFIAALFIKSS